MPIYLKKIWYVSEMNFYKFIKELLIEDSFNYIFTKSFSSYSIFFFDYIVFTYWTKCIWKESLVNFFISCSFVAYWTFLLWRTTNRYLYFGVNSSTAFSWYDDMSISYKHLLNINETFIWLKKILYGSEGCYGNLFLPLRSQKR